MRKLLISGFQPFSHFSENSSQIIAELFKEVDIAGFEIRSIILPVTFNSSFERLKTEVEKFRPDYVICLGLADKRTAITLERVAINLIHSKIPDNDGVIRLDESIIKNGPAAYFATLPLKEMVQLKNSFPVEDSFTAGTYVCNFLMYELLHYTKDTDLKAGFIHLPHLGDNKEAILQTLVDLIKRTLT